MLGTLLTQTGRKAEPTEQDDHWPAVLWFNKVSLPSRCDVASASESDLTWLLITVSLRTLEKLLLHGRWE